MLIFDQLRRNDPPLRLLTLVVFGGLCFLFAGLWWVQIVSSRYFEAKLETQSLRSVRVPAKRGKILDRDGNVLAENRPSYNASLYLDELRVAFDAAATEKFASARAQHQSLAAEQEKALNRKLTRQERRQFVLSQAEKDLLRRDARYTVASNVVVQLSQCLQQPLTLDATNFQRHYERNLAVPLTVGMNLDAAKIARLQEHVDLPPGLDLDVQPVRVYPYGTTAAHLLGHVTREKGNDSLEGEEAFFDYRRPDFRGMVGIEAGFDRDLRGQAGAKSVLVNNLGYRQSESIWTEAEPGKNVFLTIDLPIQQAAERAFERLGPWGASTRGAVVVMDTRNGDILALVSSPTFNPNHYIQGFPPGESQRLNDPKLRPQINRATQEKYAPGSIFKTVVALAALDAGLNPAQTYNVESDPKRPGKGCVYVGNRKIEDTAAPGEYDFKRALIHSSNAYFITNGIHVAGISNIVRLGQRLHLGERTGLPTRQEVGGDYPDFKQISAHWFDGHTANICIGQGEIAVTPLQMAVLTSAIANGGKVFYPRLVDRTEPQESALGGEPVIVPRGRVRDELGVKPRSLEILRDAMLADVEDSDGTGWKARVPGLRICAKTGTAQVKNQEGEKVDQITWFISFAPYENPRYAVVVMVESGGSGGDTCAPIAGEVYRAIQKREQAAGRPGALAQAP